MKRSVRSFEECPRQPKRHQKVSREQRNVLISVFRTSRETCDISIKEYLEDIRLSGLDVADSTFYKWLRTKDKPSSPSACPMTRGRPPRLLPEQMTILAGWVGVCFDRNIQVHLRDYIDVTKTIFNIQIGLSVAQRCLVASDITPKLMQVKNSGFKILNVDLAKMLWDWVQDQRNLRSFQFPLSKIASIDFTFTGHRQDRQTTYAFAGAGQPKFLGKISSYTNCIITCLGLMG